MSDGGDPVAEWGQPPRRGPLARLLPARWIVRATDPRVLFPVVAVLLLGVIWGMTLYLIRVEYAAARRAALSSATELAETYEAQVVRAFREIDQTLKTVRYAYESGGGTAALPELRARELLPPGILFVVGIAGADGQVLASTREAGPESLVDLDVFRAQRRADTLSISHPRRDPDSGEWTLYFGRRLEAPDGSFAGTAYLSVGAAYFVSGYEPAKLGEQGLIGILGTDGVFYARRTGSRSTAGAVVDFAAATPGPEGGSGGAGLLENPSDGVRRFTAVRELYGLPMAVMVGLAEHEQLAGARRKAGTYAGWAAAGSVLVLLIVLALGRLSRQLTQARQRAVEARMAYAARVEHLAYHDSLTTLPNRSLFSQLLNQAIHQAHRYERRLAVLFLDLDGFKQVNDALGHEAGDHLLCEAATRLKGCLRDSDTVARVGGDEFVVALPEIEQDAYAETVAEKILLALATPFTLQGREAQVSVSIGISTYPEDGLDEQTLTKRADIAMYRAKQEGKNGYRFYSAELSEASSGRPDLDKGLRQALARDELHLHYQAKRDLRTGQITGTEALLRWRHPEHGMLAPMTFIPVAEESGLIIPIGKWVLRAVCRQAVAWRRQGLPRLTMAVNLTARQFFDEDLLTDLASILGETEMAPDLLELEISESLLMRDPAEAMRVLAGLKDMGVRIAINDFGLGYSLLSALRRFPLDTVKIDRSFVSTADDARQDKALIAAIIAMSKALSLSVVAQGVETRAQARFLQEQACSEIQGFYFARPMPADELARLLRSHRASARGAPLAEEG